MACFSSNLSSIIKLKGKSPSYPARDPFGRKEGIRGHVYQILVKSDGHPLNFVSCSKNEPLIGRDFYSDLIKNFLIEL